MRNRNLVRFGAPVIALALSALVTTVITASEAQGATACPGATVLSGSNFEIDANANLKVDGSSPCIDWLNGGANTALRIVAKADKPSGSNDDSFGQGTSEDDANPTIDAGSIPPNKSDLKTFGVFAEDTTSPKYLELFWQRVNNPSGTTNMDFELNQKFCDPTATPTNCANNSVATPETPIRTPGDKLITYDLAGGGTVPTLSIRTWTAGSGKVAAHWGTALSLSASDSAGSVNTSTIPTNESGGLALDANGVSPYTFGEAAISFPALFASGTSDCRTFGGAYLKSRASDSFTAAVKDFIGPQKVRISNCSSITTTATATANVGDSTSDTAHLSGVASNAGGTITFKAWTACDTTTDPDTASGLVFTSAAVPVSGSGDYNSGDASLGSGTYYWTAVYSGDQNNQGSAGQCGDANESTVVAKKQPAIVTSAVTPVTVGNTISDTATLSNGTTDISGTITFSLYSTADCSGTPAYTHDATVSGNGDYGSGNYTTTVAGTYKWIASYAPGADTKNLSVSGACGDAGETSVVNKKQPTISTTANESVVIDSAIHDTAFLANGYNPTGSVSFALYATSDCSGPALYTTTAPSNGDGSYGPVSYTPTAVGTYKWIASYATDTNNLAVSGACSDTGEVDTVGLAGTTTSSAQTLYPTDSATISANAGAGGTPTGTIRFQLFTSNTCGGTPVYDSGDKTLVAGSASTGNQTSFGVAASSTTTYYWLVSYSGDSKHSASAGTCGYETFTASVNH